MLSISNALKGADSGNYYLRISSEEYYARSGSERGKFFGGAVGSLVESSEFNREQFVRLLEGFDERGMALVQNAGDEDRWRGWDLTLSAPKSVSVLWALSSKKYRRLIRKAHDRAVRDALRWIEEHHCITRRGKTCRKGEADGLFQSPILCAHAKSIFLDHTTASLRSRADLHRQFYR